MIYVICAILYTVGWFAVDFAWYSSDDFTGTDQRKTTWLWPLFGLFVLALNIAVGMHLIDDGTEEAP